MLKNLYGIVGDDYYVLAEGEDSCNHSFVHVKRTNVFEEWTCDIPNCGRQERVYFPRGANEKILQTVIHIQLPPNAFIRDDEEKQYKTRANDLGEGEMRIELDRDRLSTKDRRQLVGIESTL